MEYISTRDRANRYSLREAAYTGLAPCGGLYMPVEIPQIDLREAMAAAERGYADLALLLARPYFGAEVGEATLERVVRTAYDFAPVMHHFEGSRAAALELFHGPTFAFKDYGARFMGGMLGALNAGSDRELVILTATSGDTGSAVAGGFYGVEGVKVILLFPRGRISPLQESQMTTLGGNIHPFSVEGSFDDCQRMVKEIFADHAYCAERNITSANSINILRWIPQSFYYYYGYYLWLKNLSEVDRGVCSAPDIVVPSGNYGNLSAGMLARRMGLPIGLFVAASNANDVIPSLLGGGDYSPRESVRTLANAMDVGTPSNYERMMSLVGGDLVRLRSEIEGFSVGDDRIRETIREVYNRYGYRIDPHSAIGYLASTELDINGFWLSTAHEAKFGEVLTEALGANVAPAELPASLARMLTLPRHSEVMAPRSEELRGVIERL